MKKISFLLLVFSLALASQNSFAALMKFSSNDVKSGKAIGENQVFDGFGCTGKNQSPALTIHGVPKEAKSLAITMYDPDAPTGSGWWHWIVYDIDPTVTEIATAADKISENAVIGRNDYGTFNYGGPCPPLGTTHRYVFSLYALDVEKLDVPAGASAAMIGYNLKSHAIKVIEFVAPYSRKK